MDGPRPTFVKNLNSERTVLLAFRNSIAAEDDLQTTAQGCSFPSEGGFLLICTLISHGLKWQHHGGLFKAGPPSACVFKPQIDAAAPSSSPAAVAPLPRVYTGKVKPWPGLGEGWGKGPDARARNACSVTSAPLMALTLGQLSPSGSPCEMGVHSIALSHISKLCGFNEAVVEEGLERAWSLVRDQ